MLVNRSIPTSMIRLTEKCRRSDYCYSNGPQIKMAVNPNDMPLYLQRTDIIGAFIVERGYTPAPLIKE